MKSKFFGLNAKLALAVLAVGTMFTSCYDSENGDVNKPYVPEPAKYVITGNVTDYETGEAISATVTVPNFTVTTDGATFSAVAQGLTAVTTVPVEISATGYTSVTRNVIVEPIETGVAVYTVNVALWNEAAIPGIEVEVVDQNTASTTFAASSVPTVDLVNDTDEPMGASLSVNELWTGAQILSYTAGATSTASNTKAIGATVEEVFVNYCKAYLGVDPLAGISMDGTQDFDFTIPAHSSVFSATVETYRVDEKYTFTYEGQEYTYLLRRITGYGLLPDIRSNEIYHGHGHGHGHGGDLNAGGGIFE